MKRESATVGFETSLIHEITSKKRSLSPAESLTSEPAKNRRRVTRKG